MISIISKLKNRPNWVSRWRSSGDNHPFSKYVLYNGFKSLRTLFYFTLGYFNYMGAMTKILSPKSVYVEAVTNVMVFGDGNFWRYISQGYPSEQN